jgi:hypothetical protein
MADDRRGNEFSTMIARLRPGATIEQLDAQMRTSWTATSSACRSSSRSRNQRLRRVRVPFRDELVGDARDAAAHHPGRRLPRPAHRLRERRQPAADACDGADARAGDPHDARRRPLAAARQLLTEGLVLSLAGARAGVALGYAGLRALSR